jgi:hypothetical protein
MKKLILLIVLCLGAKSFAQTNGITYQAVILNPSGEQLPGVNNTNAPMVDKNICMQFQFIDAFSKLEYQETIQTKTDAFGMVNLVIGSGKQTAGYAASFQTIDWTSFKKSMIVSINTSGSCSSFTEISNQPFTAVPFAFSAINAGNVTGVVAIENGGTNAITIIGAKINLGLEKLDNTSDLDKPISNATLVALNLNTSAISVNATAISLNTAKVGITTQQASAITANTAKVGYTDALVSANTDVAANNAKTGITAQQASDIIANNAKTGITTQQASAITANTAKVGYTDALVSANTDVAANTAKTGITAQQASDITANNAKTGITTQQASAITANTAKVGYTDALVSANTDVAANNAKTGITAQQASDITANNAKTGITSQQSSDITTNNAKVSYPGDQDLSALATTAATTTALNLKANIASPTFTGTVTGITAAMVGLENVDNTSDANKPVSTAAQIAIDLKANLDSPSFTGVPEAPTPINTTNSTQIATTAFVQDLLLNSSSTSSTQLNGAIWTSNTTGTLNGIGFTVGGYTMTSSPPSLLNSDYSTADYSSNQLSATQQTSYFMSGSSWTVTFDSPISNLKLYVYWRSGGIGGSSFYQFDQAFSIASGSTGMTNSGNNLNISGWGKGILEFSGPITTLTLSADGSSCCSGHTITFASGVGGIASASGTGQVIRIDSPNLSGTPTAPTAAFGTNTTQLATTAFVAAAIGTFVDLTTAQIISGSKSFSSDMNINGLTIGTGAGDASVAIYNTALGKQALQGNTTGFFNTAFGVSSLFTNTEGARNTAIGSQALYRNNGYDNTALGYRTLENNSTGSYNLGIGSEALRNNTSGEYNTALGSFALNNNTEGVNNTAVGTGSLANSTTGSGNTASGYNSLPSNTTGTYNVAYGVQSLEQSTTANQNTAIGVAAIDRNTTGSSNAVLGAFAGRYISDGNTYNTLINNSVLIGAETKPKGDDETNQIVIGFQAKGNGSNTIQLGNTSITNVKTSGTLTAGAITIPNTDGTSGQVLSTNGSGAVSWINAPTGTVSSLSDLSVTATASELNILDGVTATATELNIIDGVTATTAELNIMDGSATTQATVTLVGTDGIVISDGDIMKQALMSDIKTYVEGGSGVTHNQVVIGSWDTPATELAIGDLKFRVDNGYLEWISNTGGSISFGMEVTLKKDLSGAWNSFPTTPKVGHSSNEIATTSWTQVVESSEGGSSQSSQNNVGLYYYSTNTYELFQRFGLNKSYTIKTYVDGSGKVFIRATYYNFE